MNKYKLKTLLKFSSVFFLVIILPIFPGITIKAWTPADAPAQIITSWGDTKLNNPGKIDFDSAGNIYVADGDNHRMIEFDSTGNYLSKIYNVPQYPGTMRYVSAVSIDSGGNIFIADKDYARIEKFNNSGVYQSVLDGYLPENDFQHPIDIKHDASDNLYLLSYTSNALLKFNNSGVLVSSMGSGILNQPNAFDFDSAGNIWIADQENHRLEKFSGTGSFLSQIALSDASYGVAVDSSNNIYTLIGDTVYKFDATGAQVLTFGTTGSGDGELATPRALRIDPVGDLIVSDSGNNRLEKFDTSGNYLSQINPAADTPNLTGATAVALDSAENIYVLKDDQLSNQVEKLDPYGNLLLEFGPFGSGDGELSNPLGIAIGPDDKIYVADTYNYRIVVFNPDGSFNRSFGDDVLSGPSQLYVDSSNNVYVADAWNGLVFKFDASDTVVLNFDNTGSGNPYSFEPTGIAVAANGDIFVADPSNGYILKFDSTGNYQSEFGVQNISDSTVDGAVYGANQLVIDANGYLFVSEKTNYYNNYYFQPFCLPEMPCLPPGYRFQLGNNRVQKFDLAGNFIMKFGSYGSDDGQFEGVGGMALSAGKDLYVADFENNRIQKFIFDTNPPVGTIILNDNVSLTNTATVPAGLFAFDPTSTVTQMKLSQNAALSGASWESYVENKQLTLSGGDGSKTVYVQYQDAHTNVSSIYNDSVVVDTTPPTGSITINSGAETTTSRYVTLKLPATDNLSGVTAMEICNRPDFIYCAYQAYANSKNWILTASTATKTVYVKYRDLAGNESTIFTDTIDYFSDGTEDNILELSPESYPESLPTLGGIPRVTPPVAGSPVPLSSTFLTNTFGVNGQALVSGIATLLLITGLLFGTLNPSIFFLYAVPWFRRRKYKNPWGIVYDTDTSLPIAFTTVRLFQNGKFIQQMVTDLKGRYGFIVDQGSYEVVVKDSLYFEYQEQVNVSSHDQSVIKNIGLTPRGKESLSSLLRLKYFFNTRRSALTQINNFIFAIGFVFSIIALVSSPIVYNQVIFALYCLILFYLAITRSERSWGYLKDENSGAQIQGAWVKLYDQTGSKQLDVNLTDDHGRYGFIVDSGDYSLEVYAPGFCLTEEFKNGRNVRTNINGAEIFEFNVKKGTRPNLSIFLEKNVKNTGFNSEVGKFAQS